VFLAIKQPCWQCTPFPTTLSQVFVPLFQLLHYFFVLLHLLLPHRSLPDNICLAYHSTRLHLIQLPAEELEFKSNLALPERRERGKRGGGSERVVERGERGGVRREERKERGWEEGERGWRKGEREGGEERGREERGWEQGERWERGERKRGMQEERGK
jgi:hypothetical protein